MNNPLVSIIIPVYNVEDYLPTCIESIMNQTFHDWEMILVNDGSLDMSGIICDQYSAKDNRIKTIHKQNAGVGAARNTGIMKACGEFIVFVDSDDFCDVDYLRNFIIDKVDDDELIIQGYHRYSNKVDCTVSFTSSYYYKENLVDGILENQLLTFGAPYCKLFKRSLIVNNKILFSNQYSFGEDTYFFFHYLNYINNMRLVDKSGYYYRCNQTNSLSVKNHEFKDLSDFANDSLFLIRRIDTNDKLEKMYSYSYVGIYSRALANMYRLGYDVVMRRNCINIIKGLKSNNLKLFDGFSTYKFVFILARDWPFIIVDTLLRVNYLVNH